MRTDALPPKLLELLHNLMKFDPLKSFSLGGGTSLALRFGHRTSVDIDLFTNHRFESEVLLNVLKGRFSDLEIFNRTTGSLCLAISDVKVDLFFHAYGQLKDTKVAEGIRLVSLEDVAAMKINAVTNRGSKKDFADLLLLHHQGITLGEAVELFCRKYGRSGKFLAIRSLQFFGDAREEPDPVFLNGWTWGQVESEISTIVRNLLSVAQVMGSRPL